MHRDFPCRGKRKDTGLAKTYTQRGQQHRIPCRAILVITTDTLSRALERCTIGDPPGSIAKVPPMNEEPRARGDSLPHERISRTTVEHLLTVRGEGDEWDFKATLGDLSSVSARVNLAKDALAFSNLREGGTLIVGVTSSYDHVGLRPQESIDTTLIRNAIDKYIDGDYLVLAAEHGVSAPGETDTKRYGIIYFHRRGSQPVLAAKDGQIENTRPPIFRSGDILIRRGAASVRANSGDVRRLLTSSAVHDEKIRAVNEVWNAIVHQRRLLSGLEYLYNILAEPEYPEVPQRELFRSALGRLTQREHADQIDNLQLRVALLRPHLSPGMFDQYRSCSALIGRLHMKAIEQRDEGVFLPWTLVRNGDDDVHLQRLALRLIPEPELHSYWTGHPTNVGVFRPLQPVIDAAEREILTEMKLVLSGKNDIG